ncbi:hypothetical protein [Pseudomonas koreensis]|uniref:hypothetical protein n=1 Tax=Pseudomonas koreensis TaxID=198620 RepID=UPI0014123378|nr:hypothetical protein [Pseudomonas koreensis]NHX03201.1 hypothetical protein [Pseudomonas koreensis]
MGIAVSAGGDFSAAITAMVEDIVEYGFATDPFKRPDQYSIHRPGAVTTYNEIKTISARYRNWADLGNNRTLLLPVPILYPQIWFHTETSKEHRSVWDCEYGAEKPLYSGPEGNRNSVEADKRCPYSGRGARAGQLIYKYGENGLAQPVWNEYSFTTLNEEGELYFRINTTNDDLESNSGNIKIIIARNPAITPKQDMIYTVYAQCGWKSTKLPRWTNWKLIDSDGYSPNAFMSMPMPAILERSACWRYAPDPEPEKSVVNAVGALRYPYCGPGGCKESVEGDTRYPYHGPGAKRGQLLFKYGAKGTVLPLWSGDAVYAQECTGSLYLACNGPTVILPDDNIIRSEFDVSNAGFGLLSLRIS